MSFSYNGRGRSYGSRGYGTRRFGNSSYNQQNARPAGGGLSKYINKVTEVQSQVAYVAKNSFSDFGLYKQLLDNITQHGYETPTSIQDQAIPHLMNGKDVVGIANTGTGKTAAFLLPLIHKVIINPDQGVLILAPTRELAVQIFDELKVFTFNMKVGLALCIGGSDISRQIHRLKNDPHFVIGTPGRIKDLIKRRAFNTELYANVVLDEVDRMLDIGFRKDIMFLISQLPEQRHAAFFTATMTNETEEIMNSFLTEPVRVNVRQAATAKTIHQDIVTITPDQNKVDVLHELLRNDEFEKVIVFGRTKHGINKLENQLFSRGIKVTSIHGNKSQGARQRSLQEFKQGKVQALLATDVAARGIDVNDVTHVINYDEPTTYDDYIHRIGRTGRAGKVGKALTFISR